MKPAFHLILILTPQATKGSIVTKAQVSPATGHHLTIRQCWPRLVELGLCSVVTLLVHVFPAPVHQRESKGIIVSLVSFV